MKILVTGVAGFMGSHIAEQFVKRGDEVIGIDNLKSHNSSVFSCIPLPSQPITNTTSVSKDVSLSIYGNPLIQVGDIVSLTYPLSGINQQQYVVHSVSHSFAQGLSTSLILNQISSGIAY